MHNRTGKKRAAVAVACSVVLALGLAGCTGDPAAAGPATLSPDASLPSDMQDQLSDAVEEAMAATGSSGAIVGVWVPWSGRWVTGLGTVTAGGDTPVDADMTFRAGQVTRAMTCDVLYRLVDEGTVKLNDPVTDYVGGMPKYADITLEQLCDGTSGLGSYGKMLKGQSLANPDREWDPRELVGYGIGVVEGDVEPGLRYTNSAAGYVLLGLALESASGMSAHDLFEKYVIRPLGLSHTDLPGPEPALPTVDSSTPLHGFYLASRKKKSGAYNCEKQTDITEQSSSYGFTDAGVVSDIRDLGQYAHALATGALVSNKSRLAEPLSVSKSSAAWFTTSGGIIESGPLLGGYGTTNGYMTAAFSDPDSGLTVAVVLNNSTSRRAMILQLARELAALAAKTPAAKGGETASVGLPWTAEHSRQRILDEAICATASK